MNTLGENLAINTRRVNPAAYLRTIVAAVAFLGFTVPALTGRAQTCKPFDNATETGTIAHEPVNEASGLAASWRHKGLWWTHNDSGGHAKLFLMESDGSHVATVTLAGVERPKDWEDVAVGPCQKGSKKSCVFVADVGDNGVNRDKVVIRRFEEPALPKERPADISVKATTPIWFTYPGGARNAETVMVHPKTSAIYLVEKTSQRDPGVYRLANKKAPEKKPALAVEVGQLRFGAQSGFGKMITAGDISPDGTEFTVRTYLLAYTFCAKGKDLEAAVKAAPVTSHPPFMIQSEALGYDREGTSIWITSERRPSPIYRMTRQKDEAEDTEADP